MSVEAAVFLLAAWQARSPTLLAFGGDSAIELASAVVVLWRFNASAAQEHAEQRAGRIARLLLFVLAACVVASSVIAFVGYGEPKLTFPGIAMLIIAAVVVPSLAKEKRLSVISYRQCCLEGGRRTVGAVCLPLPDRLTGLAINAIWRVKWADPVAALAVLLLII
jgi:hypothetical protein